MENIKPVTEEEREKALQFLKSIGIKMSEFHSGKYKDWTFGCIGSLKILNTSQLKFDNGFFIPYLSYKYILN